jgi:hypothetical protein
MGGGWIQEMIDRRGKHCGCAANGISAGGFGSDDVQASGHWAPFVRIGCPPSLLYLNVRVE